MGGEFIPTSDEGDFVIPARFKTGTSLTKQLPMTTKIEQIILKNFPEQVGQNRCCWFLQIP
jgi:cobalt-zinc-cadmium resistance protein CzcA